MINKKTIESWVLTVVNDGSWMNYNDLHIDNISVELKKPTTWLLSGLECFNIAIDIIKKNELPFVVELDFSLKSNSNIQGVNFVNSEQLIKQFSWTPPSLYLFKPDWENFKQGIKRSIKIDFIDVNNSEWYFCEQYNPDDKEYRRSLFLVSHQSED